MTKVTLIEYQFVITNDNILNSLECFISVKNAAPDDIDVKIHK